MDHIAEITAGFSYAPAGIIFGYLLLQPMVADRFIACQYNETLYWPYIITIVVMLVTVVLTNGLKLNYCKTQFIHLYLDLAACLFSLTAGLVLLFVDDVVPAVYMGAIALGLTLVPGLSYLHIRSKGRHRALYMSLCTFWFLAGIASTATVVAQEGTRLSAADGGWTQDTLNQNVAISLLASGSLLLVLIGLVELLQRETIVDYRKPLDYDTAMAHDSGRLLGVRKRSFGTYAQFGREFPLAAGKSTAWSSTDQIVGPPATSGWGACRFRSLWTVYAIATKLVGVIAFYWVLLDHGLASVVELLEQSNAWFCVFWLLAAGSLLTTLLTLLLSPKLLFLLASVAYLIGLVLAVAFYAADLLPLEYGIAKLTFYTCIGAALPLPAINILELAPLNFNEAALALGMALELMAIALLQYFGTLDGTLYGVDEPPAGSDDVFEADKDTIAAHYITAIVIGVVCAVLVLWHIPNTRSCSLPEIENELARMRSYFAFSRSAVPSDAVQPDNRPGPTTVTTTVNGAPDGALSPNGASSVGEQVEDNQLSARNAAGFAGFGDSLATRDGSYNSRSRSRSPFNDFGHDHSLANGHSPFSSSQIHHPLPKRSLSPRHLAEEHDFQQQQQTELQRQHEANYLCTRMRHHRALEMPTASDQYLRTFGSTPLPVPEVIQPQPLLPPTVSRTGSRAGGSLTVKSEPGGVLRPTLFMQRSDAPAPPPMPPADYLTKSLPRVKAVRQSRIPPIVPKPEQLEEVIVPGVEYSHNLVPSKFLRQTLQSSQLFR